MSITEFCDQNDLTTRERLTLFQQVCQAVQHAHQKGVIHRDLKPSNIMVTLNDGVPFPKVIDFGVAKAMHTRLTEKTLFTRYEQFVGTPAYMSPEQAELSALDVDTRTDIYSLGVLLYELLTGTTPFDTKSLVKAGLAEIQRVIREEEPPRPSVRVSTHGDAAIAKHRKSDVLTLGRMLRGDLDWIVMKALEKDRSRRYDTASELGDDVRRYLDREPVVAGPPGAAYRLRKVISRHRATASVALVMALLLIGGIVGTTRGMWQAQQSAEEASEETERALTAVDFLLSTLSLTNPEFALNPDVSVQTLLEHTSREVESAFEDDPGVETRVRATIGRAYRRLGEWQLAEPHLRRVIEIVRTHSTGDGELQSEWDPALVDAGFDALAYYDVLWSLTNVCFNLERPDAFEMASLSRRVGLNALAAVHADAAQLLRDFIAAVEAGAWSHEPNAMKGVTDLFERAAAAAESALPVGDPHWMIVAETFLAAGYTLWYTPHEPLGALFWQRCLDLQKRELPANHPDIAATVVLLVGLLNKGGELDRSEQLLREALTSLRSVHRGSSLAIATCEGMLGQTLALQGRFEEAEEALRSSHSGILRVTTADAHWLALESFVRVLQLYEQWAGALGAGRSEAVERALPYRNKLALAGTASNYLLQWDLQRHIYAVNSRLRKLGEEVHGLLGGVSVIATPASKRIDAFPDLVSELLTAARLELADDRVRRETLGRLLLGWANLLDPDHHQESRLLLADAAADFLAEAGDRLPVDLAEALALRADVAHRRGNAAAARDYGTRAAGALSTRQPQRSWFVASAKVRIARSLIAAGLYESAEGLLLPAFDTLCLQLGERHSDSREARSQLARLYTTWGKPERARQFEADPEETSPPKKK